MVCRDPLRRPPSMLSAAIDPIRSVGVAAMEKHVRARGGLLRKDLDSRGRGRRDHIYVL
ncbi:hypothetical protein AWB77_01806 [Caballeronia fortuita]|uniref:Uncharacterized protein n=1 Tax=Caballeronia fortuita TaxID=1777138 RepID=A0A158AHF8_9BURK|nr:hypothetical protein AWB77_01806 [Caballeronia fortuita]